jgi:hypothetical protein
VFPNRVALISFSLSVRLAEHAANPFQNSSH